jgi:hypothetical protein
MSFTYAQLKQAIQDYTDNTETTFVNNLPLFIRAAEERILKGVQLQFFRRNQAASVTSGNKYLACPSDFLAPYSLGFTKANGDKEFLQFKDVNFVQEFNPWAEKNDWFGQDEVMTYAAFGVHRKLVEEEGFDPQSDEYYSEIDRRMRTEFPHKFQASKSSGKSQVAPAGSSASRSTKQGRRTVKLSPSQIAIAKKLNVPLEEYAKYVKD